MTCRSRWYSATGSCFRRPAPPATLGDETRMMLCDHYCNYQTINTILLLLLLLLLFIRRRRRGWAPRPGYKTGSVHASRMPISHQQRVCSATASRCAGDEHDTLDAHRPAHQRRRVTGGGRCARGACGDEHDGLDPYQPPHQRRRAAGGDGRWSMSVVSRSCR